MLIRCFSAQAHFINSKIIESVVKSSVAAISDQNNLTSTASVVIDDDEDEMKGVDESATDTSIAVNSGPKEFSVVDVLAELDRTKRELQA